MKLVSSLGVIKTVSSESSRCLFMLASCISYSKSDTARNPRSITFAFFDFTSCEGCQLNKLNLENNLLDILEHIDIGEFHEAMDDKAYEYDIAFLEEVFTDINKIKPLVDRHDEYHKLVGQATSLYRDITEMALQNEKGK